MLNIVSTKLLAFIPTLQLVLVMAGDFFSKGIKLLLLAVSIIFGCIYALPSEANEKHPIERMIEDYSIENNSESIRGINETVTNVILELTFEEISASTKANDKQIKNWLSLSKFLHDWRDELRKSKNQDMVQLVDEWLCMIHSNLASKYNYGIKKAFYICQSYFNQYVRKNSLDSVISMPVMEFLIDIFSLNNRYDEISEIVQLAEVDSDYLASMPPEDYSTLTTNLGRMSIYLDARKKGFAILKNYVKILEIDTDILKSFYSEINDEFNMYCQVLETKNDYRIDALLATKNYDLSSIILQHCINDMEKLLQRIYELKLGGEDFSLGDNRGNGRGVFRRYTHLYQYLALISLEQNQIEKAVEYLDRGRLLGLSFLMYRRNEYIKFAEIQRLAKENNSTFVIYSIFPNFGSDPNHKKDLGIFVIQPSGKLYFKLVPLNNIPSIVSSTSETLQKRSEQKIQSKPVFPSLTIFIGLGGFIVLTTCLVLFIRHKKIWYANGIAVILVIAGVSSFLYVQNQVLILNQPEPEEAPSPTVASSSNLTDITRLIDSSFSQNRSVKIQDTGTIAQDDQDCPNQETCLASLYQILIQPIEEYLPKEENSSIIFVPEGELHKVSFASLKDANGSYLIDKYVIGVTPSLRILKALPNRDKNTARDTNALIVGNPTMPPDPEAPDFDLAGTAANPQRYQNLPPLTSLPNAEIEAIEIAKLLGTPPLIGAEATRANVLSKMTSAKTIHLATHGLPYGFGVLALAPTNSEEGYLTGFHIADKFADKKLQADLVVLSACDTGTGHMSTEGSIGFARPFFMAGVPTVVASLWQVPDASTAELMVDFYKNMQTTDNKAQALRQAMLKTKEKYPDPYHWAGFVLFGRP